VDLQQIPPQYRSRAESVLQNLRSYFIDMPRGPGFLADADFRASYELFCTATKGGRSFTPETVIAAVVDDPRAWTVLRAVAGVTPPEAAALAMEAAIDRGQQLSISAQVARDIDARCKRAEAVLLKSDGVKTKRAREHSYALDAMARALTELIASGPGEVGADRIHRLDKIDTREGLTSLREAFADGGSMYPELLYERVLGRPFATHRDAVSGLVGDSVEEAVMDVLEAGGIPARRTFYREKVETFDQAPDIVAPFLGSIYEVELALESKMAEDDGTARDKVARVMRLREHEDKRAAEGLRRRQIVAVLEGRGFGVREPDLARLLQACDGHVYTAAECQALIEPGGPFAKFVKKS
jgi:hypothetical protein